MPCHPCSPRANPLPPTARCPHRRWSRWAAARSGSTCTCRSAPPVAATATSTPTRRGNWARPRHPPRGWTGCASSWTWPHVYSAPLRAPPRCSWAAAREARAAGFEHVNLDLIYGTPGESAADLAASLESVLAAGVDHVSAYALIVEEGTALARRIARGELPAPDDEVLADRYEQLD